MLSSMSRSPRSTERVRSQALTNLTNYAPSGSVVDMAPARRVINLYDAKTQLSSLVEQAAAGAEIVIAKGGKPRAKLVRVGPDTARQPGRAKGKIWIAADFDAPLPTDVLSAFGHDPT